MGPCASGKDFTSSVLYPKSQNRIFPYYSQHYITLEIIHSGQSKSNFKTTMAIQLQNNIWVWLPKKCVFSFWRNVASDGAEWTSAGRLFQNRGPAAAKERSPTVTRRDGRTSIRLEVVENSWPQRY